jgi:hypothetical protein
LGKDWPLDLAEVILFGFVSLFSNGETKIPGEFLFVWLISHQPIVLFYKINQPLASVIFRQISTNNWSPTN